MLAALTLAAAVPATSPVLTPIILRCFVGEGVELDRFSLLIDRKELMMTVTSKASDSTTMPVLISKDSLVGRNPIHYNMTSYKVTIPELKVIRTTVPHIWAGPTPTLVAKGQCSGNI